MKKIISTLLTLSFFIVGVLPANAGIASIDLVSKSDLGVIGDGDAGDSVLSAGGEFIVFTSYATNLVDGGTNDVGNVFVYSILGESMERVSIGDLSLEPDGESLDVDISNDGRFVTFTSSATNLLDGDDNAKDDIFLYDRDLNTIELISIASDDGFANNDSDGASISSDGRYVVFESTASNLVSGDTNGEGDIFVRDRTLGTTERVSINSSDEEANDYSNSPSISGDGRYVAFLSGASNLVASDTNLTADYFLRDIQLGTTERVNVSSDEEESDGDITNLGRKMISDDGRYIIFGSDATNLVDNDTNAGDDLFVRDRTLGITKRISVDPSGNEIDDVMTTIPTSISPDGRYVSFLSNSTDYVVGDTTTGDDNYDIFVRDIMLDLTDRISMTVGGVEANGSSYSTAISFSNGGRYTAFPSFATNLVSGDTNGASDVFFAEIDDGDGISSAVEDAAPNSGDVDESGYDDAIEKNVSSFVNSVSGSYSSVVTTGDCSRNDSPSASAESALAAQDSGYDYPLGIITFSVDCKDAGETATVSVYCFCENTPVSGTIARKYSESTGEYTTIDSAVIEEVTIDGQRALKMTYDVTDGGALDEDGLENGTIVDPVGFARVAVTSSGGSSSGSRPRKVVVQNTVNNESPNTPINEDSCEKYSFTTPMKKGSKFGEVSKLQELLNKKGISVGIVDGLFGPLTDMAVKQFQSQNSLDSDGIVGPMTRGVLNKVCK